VAKLLGVNRITIWRWIKGGKFNVQRVGREVLIPKWEVDIIKVKSSRIGNGNE
jgi:excisionase family DNA binding protein